MAHALAGKPKSRTHKQHLRASMLRRSERLREADRLAEQLKTVGVIIADEAQP